jgi:hypothetical protein
MLKSQKPCKKRYNKPNWVPFLLVLLTVVFMLYYAETRANNLSSRISVLQSELDEAKRHQADMDSRFHLRKPK